MKSIIKFLWVLIILIVLIYNPISARLMTLMTAKLNNLETKIFYNQIKSESSFRSLAVSPKKAIGLGQLQRTTALYIYPSFREWMIWFPPLNLHIAAQYNLYLLEKYKKNWSLTLAAYNWGETNVDKKIKETNLKIDPSKNYKSLFKNVKETYNYINKCLI